MPALVLVTAPATEPLTVAEVLTHCRVDASVQEPAPGIITAALAAPALAGNIDNGVHRYLATFVTADGETQAGVVSAPVTISDKNVNGQASLTAIPIGGALVTARKIYRTAAAGNAFFLLTTLPNNTATTFTDNVSDASLGGGSPATNTTNDPYLISLISAARTAAERITRRALITQTWELLLDSFPPWEITMPKPTLQSVTSINYIDSDGASQTLSASKYLVDSKSEPARITPVFGEVWPVTRAQTNAVAVRFVAGYGAAAAIPAGIRQWMLIRICTLYDQRAATIVGVPITDFPRAFVDGLLDDFNVIDYGWTG